MILFICMVIAGIEFTDLISGDGDINLNFSYAFLVLAGAASLCACIFACCSLWYYNEKVKNGGQKIEGDEEVSEAAVAKEEEASKE